MRGLIGWAFSLCSYLIIASGLFVCLIGGLNITNTSKNKDTIARLEGTVFSDVKQTIDSKHEIERTFGFLALGVGGVAILLGMGANAVGKSIRDS
ncbi:MAG TPA: hypothetical protein PKD64_13250 [Pirellulaceae bacterium]|nr:hypothetical protein [Pirellulaceae bacterium]HMO93153.1 hypothetical protein [Pirellulaceae bacterium]HMP70017.1 hypothetical protein [Pirellulaceae bacterium]